MRSLMSLMLIGISLISCTSIEKEAIKASKDYCECLKESVGWDGLVRAQIKCDSLLRTRYILFNEYFVHVLDTTFVVTSPTLQDSIDQFISVFTNQIDKNCPGYFYEK